MGGDGELWAERDGRSARACIHRPTVAVQLISPRSCSRSLAILDEGLDELLVTVLPVSNADDDERELLLALQEDAS